MEKKQHKTVAFEKKNTVNISVQVNYFLLVHRFKKAESITHKNYWLVDNTRM